MKEFIRNAVLGTRSAMDPEARRRVDPERVGIVHQRHEFEESVQLLNHMRKIGGVRRVQAGSGDNGAPLGPSFIDRVDHISRNMTIDGKRLVHSLDEVAAYAASDEDKSVPYAPSSPGTYTPSLTTLQQDLEKNVREKRASFETIDVLLEND